MGNALISGIIFGICAFIMIGIGVSQIKSRKPVGFYSGVEAPDETELSDVKAWNIKHGVMWILYGLCIVLAWVCGLFTDNGLLALIPFTAGLLLPIPFMMYYHHKLTKKYFIKK